MSDPESPGTDSGATGSGARDTRDTDRHPDDSRREIARGAAAIVVLPDFRRRSAPDADARLEEACGLARAIGLDIRDARIIPIREAKAGTLFGKGQVDAIADAARAHGAELVVVDGALTAIQQRNLEDALAAKVIDRTGLILEIFGERAATAEGRLQVELAHLDYQAGRLVRSWTHLERQRGGFGFLGGPGETQIEADRRMIRDRMAKLRRELEQVKKTRGLHRERRTRAPWPVIALVGYTNAGKSTLFNRMTGAAVLAQDMLFATLDPTMRSVRLPGLDKAILSDTVGFVSDLPTQLVAAFRATLEEVLAADCICHVRDMAHPEAEAQASEVERVLAELGLDLAADADAADAARAAPLVIEAWNKWDLIGPDRRALLMERAARDARPVVPLSAVTGEGVDELVATMAAALTAEARVHRLTIDAEDGARLAWLHAHGEVLATDAAEAGEGAGPQLCVTVRLAEKDWGRFRRL